MILPKPYLSYSAISLWEKDKNEYRQRYYENKKSPESPEIKFGRAIAKRLEADDVTLDPTLSKITRYSKPEHKIQVLLDEVPILGYLDSFDPEANRFCEYKTGRDKALGSPRWTQLDVEKSEQLPIYSLLIKEKYGAVDNHVELWWLQTRFKKDTIEFAGHTLEAAGSEMELTGEVKCFKRIIYEWERQKIKEKIIRLAKEIEIDYEAYKRATIRVYEAATKAVVAKTV